MPTFTGTEFDDIITTTTISVGVASNPLGSFPGAGSDVVNANGGSDFVNTGGGNDIVNLGAGNDTFQWTIGEGNDLVDGGINRDTLRAIGSAGEDVLSLDTEGAPLGTAFMFGNFDQPVTFNGIEVVDFRPLDDGDTVFVGNLVGTQVTEVNIDLAGAAGGPDKAFDSVEVDGAEGSEIISVTAVGNGVRVSGTTAQVTIINADVGKDKLKVKGFGGADTIDASALPANMMLVDLRGGDGDDILIGTAGNNQLSGDDGSDTLTGGAGADELIGSAIFGAAENDTASYATSAAAVKVSLATQTGVGGDAEGDTLIEIESLTGSLFADTLIGNGGANVLAGLAGNDTLDGGAGADAMAGGLGNDTYVVDSQGDQAIEAASAGTDLVRSSFSFVLAQNVENLTLTGAADINGTGNELANTLSGNAGANALTGLGGNDRLDGGAGADTMTGGVGNDTYVADNAADLLIEGAAAGVDQVLSSVSFGLAANIENLTLIGTGALTGTGNALSNIIVGNVAANLLIGDLGNDKLNGGAGLDTLRGGKGNDTYVVDSKNDKAIEASKQGTDKVLSSVSFKLGANVEHLTLTGSAKIDGIGNTLANVITGNAKANALIGGAGNDKLIGGLGNDKLAGGLGNDKLNGGAGKDLLSGGAGNDAFVFNTALSAKTNFDKIAGFSVKDDVLQLDNAIFKAIGKALTADEFHIGAKAADAGDHVIYNKATGNLFYDANGSGAGGATLFANVGAGLAITHQDFLIV